MQFITRGYNATGHYRSSREQARATPISGHSIQHGPLLLMSLGTLLVIFWLVLLLPGQDIAAWQREQQRLAANRLNEDICLPRSTADPLCHAP